MQKKPLWAGVVGGSIEFFGSDPQGTVEGLSGTRKFYVEQNGKLTDDNGSNIISNTSTGGGANVTDVADQHGQNTGPQGGAAIA